MSIPRELDLCGLKCPLPVLKTRKAMRDMSPGEQIAVITTDPMAAIDFPHFCQENGHLLISTEASKSGQKFVIECG